MLIIPIFCESPLVPCRYFVQTTQVKREITKEKPTEEWGCETGTGAAFLVSMILILIVTVIASGCEKSGTCSGFWKGRAQETRCTSYQSNTLGSSSRTRGLVFPTLPVSFSPLHSTWTASVNRIVIESKSEIVTSNRSQKILKIANWSGRMSDLGF